MAQKMVYQWGNTKTFTAHSPQVIGERLESIRVTKGHLEREAIVEDATPGESPLHKLFEWNNEIAAHKFRLEQAGYLIRHINVVIEDDGKTSPPVRAFVSLNTEAGGNSGRFESIAVIASSPEKRELLLKQALMELNQWRQRYAELQEFMRLHQAIDKMLLVIGKEATSAAQASA